MAVVEAVDGVDIVESGLLAPFTGPEGMLVEPVDWDWVELLAP